MARESAEQRYLPTHFPSHNCSSGPGAVAAALPQLLEVGDPVLREAAVAAAAVNIRCSYRKEDFMQIRSCGLKISMGKRGVAVR